MSGPSLMSNVVGSAISSADGLVSSVGSLTSAAIAALDRSIVLTDGSALEYGIFKPDYKVVYEKKDYLEGLPVIPDTQPDPVPTPELPPRIPEIELSEPPTINPVLNSFNNPSPPGQFNDPVPFVEGAVDILGSLDLTSEFSPRRLRIDETVGELNLGLPPAHFVRPDGTLSFPSYTQDIENIKSLIYNGSDGIPGLNDLTNGISQLAEQVLHEVLPLLSSELAERFSQAYATVNARKETLLDALYQQSMVDSLTAQEQKKTRLMSYKGWKLPALVQTALNHTFQEQIDPYVAKNLSKRRIQIIENASKLLGFCLELYSKFRFSIEEIKMKEMEMVLAAHQNAQAYARNAVEVLLKIFETEEYKLYEVLFKLKESEIKLFENQLQADMLQYEVVKANLEIEKSKQSQDQQKIRLFEADLSARASSIKALSAEMETINQTYELKKIPLEIMKAKIAAFGSRILVEEAELKRRMAIIEKKDYQVKEEAAKVQVFERQVQAFEQIVNTKEQFLNQQVANNEARITAYAAAVKGNMIPVKFSALKEQHKLYGHEAGAETYREEAQRAIKEAKMTMEFERQKKEAQDEVAKILNDIAVDLQSIELDRRRAVAEVNLKGASVFASMAEGAMSAANLVVGGAMEEFA